MCVSEQFGPLPALYFGQREAHAGFIQFFTAVRGARERFINKSLMGEKASFNMSRNIDIIPVDPHCKYNRWICSFCGHGDDAVVARLQARDSIAPFALVEFGVEFIAR